GLPQEGHGGVDQVLLPEQPFQHGTSFADIRRLSQYLPLDLDQGVASEDKPIWKSSRARRGLAQGEPTGQSLWRQIAVRLLGKIRLGDGEGNLKQGEQVFPARRRRGQNQRWS